MRPLANDAGSVMLTVGGCVSPVAGLIVTETAALVTTIPQLSVARAVRVCVPAGAGVQLTEYGALVSAAPIAVLPSKNCTLVTMPSLSPALAISVIGVPTVPCCRRPVL